MNQDNKVFSSGGGEGFGSLKPLFFFYYGNRKDQKLSLKHGMLALAYVLNRKFN